MKLAKIYNEVIKARLKDEKLFMGNYDEETVGISTDGCVMYFIPKNTFLLDVEKMLGNREMSNLENFQASINLPEVQKSNEYRKVERQKKEISCVKIGNKYVNEKFLKNFDNPTFKTQMNRDASPIYIYEQEIIVGLVMPIIFKEGEYEG